MDENKNIDEFVKKVLSIKNEQEKTRLNYQDLSEIAQQLGLDQETLAQEVIKLQERGKGFLSHQNYEDALVALEQAYTLNPENIETLKMLLQAYFEAWKQDKNANYKEKAFEKAEEILEQIPDYEKSFEVISTIKKSNENKQIQTFTDNSTKKNRKVGDIIKVLWQERIYDATIIDIEGMQYKIRYKGYSDYWNEWITEKRIPSQERINHIKSKNKKNIIRGLIILSLAACIFLVLSYLGQGFVYKLIHKQSNSGIYNTNYKVGDKVRVEWKGIYYDATIIDKNISQYKISYDGYGSSWDEWVNIERLKP
ncbi:MAG: hypothetical protein MUC49_05370 [Raineya sp.]|jgi:tetratricopeptide (TPR) repeat protein|nr:hypothetical protein [Raineya sp.]